MSCITLTALDAMMTTTEVMPAVSRENNTPWLPEHAEQRPVRMNWVVVTDENHKPQIRVHWKVSRTG